jgi:RNA polymerase sigma-70 factor (ECF subfamily)
MVIGREGFPVRSRSNEMTLNGRMDDHTLVTRALAGDQRAFDVLFESYFPRLFRFALRRVAQEDAAEDIVQVTLIKAMRSLGSWRGEAGLFTWLCTICRHEISAYWLRIGRQPDTSPIDDHPDVRAALEALSSGADRPDRALERTELGGAVHTVLDHLPGRYGDVLEWKYAEGLSVAEIAARLESTEKAVESMLTRARLAFREGFGSL